MESSIHWGHPDMSKDCVRFTHKVFAIDQSGKRQELLTVAEVPLTLKVDGFEIVTLMTIGKNQPEELTLGYLRDQGFIEKIEEIISVAVDWEYETINVVTRRGAGIHHQIKSTKPTVTSGCGQGTLFDLLF